ncbi:hypothetical protein GEOBRER4_n3163 [Citrifermentans bremense]|uniref:Uncharacterized protein n=1 Tax=Citrifermentans bremense TaxID=60035 RepID=A0A7R7J0C2_9BACT|nr:hypothetical protein [Citrifermentans bremense]BCO11535.1 hypothetical protein GEOBRER4_n3163 [Citrifermentans bremense]
MINVLILRPHRRKLTLFQQHGFLLLCEKVRPAAARASGERPV